MFKKILLSLFICSFIFVEGEVVMVRAENKNDQAASAVVSPKNVGNKICPVSGDKINEGMKVTYEYKGKIYNLCCSGCISLFQNHPEEYLKRVNEELSQSSVKK